MPEWIPVEEAKTAPGLRLVLTAGVPGPWGEAAKAIFHVKGLTCPRVAQFGGQPNQELMAWTGEINAPQAILDDEPSRAHWSSLILLGERLAPDKPLVPENQEQRAHMFGLLHELAGEGGLGWSRRLMLFGPLMELASDHPGRQSVAPMAERYGYSKEASDRAPERVAEILGLMANQWSRQREAGHDYLIGDRLSALDLYWAAFAALIEPLPHEACPMPAGLRAGYSQRHPTMDAALDTALLDHRQRIYDEWLELPIDLGPGFRP